MTRRHADFAAMAAIQYARKFRFSGWASRGIFAIDITGTRELMMMKERKLMIAFRFTGRQPISPREKLAMAVRYHLKRDAISLLLLAFRPLIFDGFR